MSSGKERRRHRAVWLTRGLFLLVGIVAAQGCASTSVAPLDGSQIEWTEDEQDLWAASRQLDAYIDSKDLTYRDEELDYYLEDVADQILSELGAADVDSDVRVLRDPLLNAFVLPNGTIYLHSGILARMDNEAQLATVLGHELTHYVHRHSLKEVRTERNRLTRVRIFVGILAVLAAASGSPSVASGLLDLGGAGGESMIHAQMDGYARDLEREADQRGLQALISAGYDPREAPKVFLALQQDYEETGIEEPYFFGSHPRLSERIASYEEAIALHNPDPSVVPNIGTERFQQAISRLLLENASLDMSLGRMRTAQMAIERHLEGRPGSSDGYFLLGEVLRRSGDEENLAAALAAYEEAERLNPTDGPTQRELGLLYRRQGRNAEARDALARYLSVSPDVVDGPIIQAYIDELEVSSTTEP